MACINSPVLASVHWFIRWFDKLCGTRCPRIRLWLQFKTVLYTSANISWVVNFIKFSVHSFHAIGLHSNLECKFHTERREAMPWQFFGFPMQHAHICSTELVCGQIIRPISQQFNFLVFLLFAKLCVAYYATWTQYDILFSYKTDSLR